MKANICSKCLSSVIGERIYQIQTADDWSGKCEVCGNGAVFYARKDEIEEAKSLTTIKKVEILN